MKIALFDKTGTLTKGEFVVKNIISNELELIKELVSAIEKYSNHPLSLPLTKYPTSLIATDVVEIAGYGMKGKISDKEVIVGNAKLLKENNIVFEEIE